MTRKDYIIHNQQAIYYLTLLKSDGGFITLKNLKMKNAKMLFILIPFLLLFSCDWKSKVAVIKNNISDTITVVTWNDREFGLITDSMVYNNRIYMPDQVSPQNAVTVTLADRNFSKAPDSLKLDLYIFNLDSLSRYQKLHIKNGVLSHCLLKKVEIQANKIREPLDTIDIKL